MDKKFRYNNINKGSITRDINKHKLNKFNIGIYQYHVNCQ